MNTENHEEKLKALREAVELASYPFFVAGDIELAASDRFSILVPSNNNFTEIAFPIESKEALDPLLLACTQASFGRALDPYVLGIVDSVRATLLSTTEDIDGKRLIAKLDKLNVYTPGDFFKAHVDTPKSDKMFGTLLINLPVEHEGGELVIRAPAQNRAKSVADSRESYTTEWGGNTEISWVAFFSDCEHEVLPVKSGNRVTLSFDLFLEGEGWTLVDVETLGGTIDTARQRLSEEVESLLGDSFPRLCFNLEHSYPVNPNGSGAYSIEDKLKDRDAVLYYALQNADAKVSFHYIVPVKDIYDENGYDTNETVHYLLPPNAFFDLDWDFNESDGNTTRLVVEKAGGITFDEAAEAGFVQVTPYDRSDYSFMYTAYGNEPSLSEAYASICMVATAPGLEDRCSPALRTLMSEQRQLHQRGSCSLLPYHERSVDYLYQSSLEQLFHSSANHGPHP